MTCVLCSKAYSAGLAFWKAIIIRFKISSEFSLSIAENKTSPTDQS